MMNLRKRATVVLALLLLLGLGAESEAGWVVMASQVTPWAGGGTESGGRGIGFRADTTFAIDAVGLLADLPKESFDVRVYGSTDGHQANALLAGTSAVVGGIGQVLWYDIPFNYSFAAGGYYVLHWRPTDGGLNDWAASLPYYLDSDLPIASGPATLIDGEDEAFGTLYFDNTLHAVLRVNVVEDRIPEPATLALTTLALAGLGGYVRRRRKA